MVLLRADMDALPVAENTGLSFASQARGIDADRGIEIEPNRHSAPSRDVALSLRVQAVGGDAAADFDVAAGDRCRDDAGEAVAGELRVDDVEFFRAISIRQLDVAAAELQDLESVVVLINDPDFEAIAGEPAAGKFGGKTMTFYGRWVYKYEEAARRGAIGALIVAAFDGGGFETLARQRRLDSGARIARRWLDRASRKRGNLVGLAPRRCKRCALFDEAPLEPLGVTR